MSFCTVVNCMDGRVQKPVREYLEKRYSADFVDVITEAGPSLVLAEDQSSVMAKEIIEKIKISIFNHGSVGLAVVGHYDCAGHPGEYDLQVEHIKKSIEFIHSHFPDLDTVGLWVNENWEVEEI